MSLSIIIPACNEAGYIETCLDAVAASRGLSTAHVIVVANGCTDDTVARAKRYVQRFADMGWRLDVLDLPAVGKHGALNSGDTAAEYATRAYLDADVTVSPDLMAELAKALAVPEARYASGQPNVTAQGWVSRAYARFWITLPFVSEGVPGFGLYAVNAAGRARWGAFPGIISDDTYVRIQFRPTERIKVPASYDWPMVEGFARLVRVRRRQDHGVAELASLEPVLMQNEGKTPVSKTALLTRFLRDPVAFVVYAAVTLAVRRGRQDHDGWVRGR